MALNISFTDINKIISIEGCAGIKDLESSDNMSLNTLYACLIKQQYINLIVYGLGIAAFTPEEVKEHVQEHGVGFNMDSAEYSPFEEKLKALSDSDEVRKVLSCIIDYSMLNSFQLFGSGVLHKALTPNESSVGDEFPALLS